MFQSTLPTRGSDTYVVEYVVGRPMFQSTLPTRGSDWTFWDIYTLLATVSIHAPHEGERP